MKLRYFASLAEQSFTTSPKGERLFLHFGAVLGKPYIIPDQVTEQRLFYKQVWFWRICLGILLFGQPIVFLSIPDFFDKPVLLILHFIAVMFLVWLINWLIFKNEIPKLKRATSHLSFPAYYRHMAERYSAFSLVLGLLGCLAFVGGSIWLIQSDFHSTGGWLGILIFGICAVPWGYTLLLKLSMRREKKVGENKSEA